MGSAPAAGGGSTGHLRVAFAGHARREDLGHSAAVADQLRAVFTELRLRDSILISGLAQGADQLAVRAWSETGSGTVHAVLPYLDSALPTGTPDIVTATTWLDGRAAEAVGRNGHLIQTRWVLEDADLLVVVWTGGEARGAGGTADAVRLALQRNLPVIWVKPGDPGPALVISPTALEADFGFLELLEQLQHALVPLAQPLSREVLRDVLSVPSPPAPDRRKRALLDPVARACDALLDRTIWRTFALYRRLMGGKPTKGRAAVHRSQQVFQALIMIVAVAVAVAVAVGAAPAIWPQIKIEAVLTELGLALVTFVVWASAVASLALEASLGFAEHARRSERMEDELTTIAEGIPPNATLDALQRAARSAIHLHVGQEDYWSEEAAHRHVMRGG